MKEAARALGVVPRTIAFHKYRAMKANGLTTNAELFRFALQHRLLQLTDADEGVGPTTLNSVARD